MRALKREDEREVDRGRDEEERQFVFGEGASRNLALDENAIARCLTIDLPTHTQSIHPSVP